MNEVGRPVPHQDALAGLLRSGELRIGQILVQRRGDGVFALCHRDDALLANPSVSGCADTAAEIARYDDEGNYRPLKTAPNLRHGWLLLLPNANAVRCALELFYPARLAAFIAWSEAALPTVAFRETLARQTGMYRSTVKITDPQADDLIGNFCGSDGGCLRTILWKRDALGTTPSTKLPRQKFDPAVDQTGRFEPTTPLLCQEICNLLVAEARTVVKGAAAVPA